MKEKLLFITKLLIFSLILFAFWKAPFPLGLGIWYNNFLKFTLSSIYPILIDKDASLLIINKVPYYFVPFVSLILSTPKIKVTRRFKIILSGFVVFFIFDFFTIYFGINASKFLTIPSALYYTVLLILPFILWLIPLYNDLIDLWKPVEDAPKAIENPKCPICGKMKTDMVEHIRAAHGKKSLNKFRVKRFLAKQGLKSQ